MPSIDSLSIRISASTSTAKTKVEELTRALEGLVAVVNQLDGSKFETLASATGNLAQNLSSLKGAGTKELKAIVKAIDSTSEAAQNNTVGTLGKDFNKVGEASKRAAENVEEASNAFRNVDTSGAEEMRSSMESVSQTVQRTTSKMSAFKSLLAKTKIIIPTEGLDKVDSKIQKLTEKIEDLRNKIDFKSARGDYVDDKEIEKDQEKLAGLINELERLKLKKQELESHGGFRLNASLGADVAKAGKSFGELIKKVDSFASKMRIAKRHTKDTTKATGDFSIASMKLAKELTRVTKMLKLMITRMILRKVIQNAIDGFKNLVQYSSEVDASVSLMWNSFRQLGNAVAAAVGPLISALAPALNYIIQLCIKVANAINQVISALTGHTTWTKAKTLTDSYGSSLDKANKSAKDLKKTILGFDEINQLQDNKDSGGGGGTTAPEDMFEDAKIEAKWADLAKKLRSILNQLLAPIKKAWSNIGDEVVAAWKGAFESVKKLLSDIGRDFLKVWNQPATIRMLENILRIFRDIGNIIKYLADGLDKAWNKNKTGLKILEAIRDIFAIVIQHVQNMTEATAEWAKNLDFSPILESFKDWLESMKPVIDGISGAFEDFYIKVLLPLSKWTLEKGLPELIQVFKDFNDKVEWDTIRERLNKVWEALEPFAEKVGQGLIDFIREISDALADFMNSDKWDAFIDTLIKWMDEVKPEDITNGLEKISGAFLAFKGISFLVTAASAINTFASALSGLAALASSLPIIAGVIAGLAVIIYSFVQSYGSFEAALGQLKETFSDAWSTIQEKLEKYNIAGMFARLKAAIDGLMLSLGGMKDFWDIVTLAVGKLAQGIGGALVPVLRNTIGMVTSLINIFRGLVDVIRNTASLLDGIFHWDIDKVKESWSKIWDGVDRITENAVRWLAHEVWQLIDLIIAPFKAIKYALVGDPIVIDMWEQIKKVFADSINAVVGFVTDLKNKIIQLFLDILNKVIETLKNIVDKFVSFKNDIASKITEIQNSVKEKLASIVQDVFEFVKKIKEFFTVDKWTFDGVIDGLKDTFKNAIDGVKRLWDGFVDKLNGDHQIGSATLKIHLPKFYAKGGFPDPEDGWFRASHGEMLGKFDNGQSVVANNEQITNGIAQAVYSAIMSANSGGGNSNRPIYTTIQIDGRTIARAVSIGQEEQNRLFSPVTT